MTRRTPRPARWVLALTVLLGACASGSSSKAKQPTGPAVAAVAVSGRDFAFTPKRLTVPVAGIIEVTLKSTDGGHTFVIQDVPGFKLSASSSGATDHGKVELKKGTYTFYCDVAGHRENGMVGKITVG